MGEEGAKRAAAAPCTPNYYTTVVHYYTAMVNYCMVAVNYYSNP